MKDRRTVGIAVAVVIAVVGLVASLWLLGHPESPVLVFVAMVAAGVFLLLGVVSTVAWLVRTMHGRSKPRHRAGSIF